MQDTAICLLAVTRYMKLTFSNGQNNVTVSNEESSETFQVDDDNRLLVQRSDLTKAYGEYTVDVEGQGFAFIQVMEVYLRGRGMLPGKRSGNQFSYM